MTPTLLAIPRISIRRAYHQRANERMAVSGHSGTDPLCPVVNSFRKKTTFSVKVSTFLVNCQVIQEIDCQLHQEKSNKLSTKIRKRHVIKSLVIKDFEFERGEDFISLY